MQAAPEQLQPKPQSIFDECFACLIQLKEECGEQGKGQLRVTVETLFKIVTNIYNNPMDPKYRKLSKTSKALKEKILSLKSSVQFMITIGFKEEPEQYYLAGYYKEKMEDALNALGQFI